MKLAVILVALTAVSATAVPREADTDLDARQYLENSVGPYRVTAKSGLTCRKGPGTSYAPVRTYAHGAKVSFTCQSTGTNVNGNKYWDKVGNCYVADYYLSTGHLGRHPGVSICLTNCAIGGKCDV